MALKVFDLECANGHVFEGWFSSHDDYHAQQGQGLLTCPLCNNHRVARRVAASRIHTGSRTISGSHSAEEQQAHEHRAEARRTHEESVSHHDAERAGIPAEAPRLSPELQARLMQHMRQMVRSADNVGTRFAEEARRIHEGEARERAIRGTATREEVEALADDGIAALPLPAAFDDDKLQ